MFFRIKFLQLSTVALKGLFAASMECSLIVYEGIDGCNDVTTVEEASLPNGGGYQAGALKHESANGRP